MEIKKKFKVRELSGNFMLCQGKMIFVKLSGKCQGILQFPVLSNEEKLKARAVFLIFWIVVTTSCKSFCKFMNCF